MLFRLIVFSTIIFITTSCTNKSNAGSISPLSTKELVQIIDKAKSNENIEIIDLRTYEEIKKTGILPGATQINFFAKDFDQSLKNLNKKKTYVIYCKAGGRSARTAKKMKKLGLTVKDYKGGMDGWISKNNKTVSAPAR